MLFHRLLEKLLLIGKLRRVPQWFNTLHNLKYLDLQWSGLREDALPHIQTLPNLLHLSLLSNAFLGERLWFVEGFPKLKILEIMGCPQLKEILVERGTMPELEELRVLRCRELRRLPYGWEHLTHLKEVRLFEVSDDLVESISGKANDNLQSSPYISLIRIIGEYDDEDDVESMWTCQILN
ncbi:RESISTANCE TO PSEUDOMONAS SYRINGAE 3, RESISTANCE TO P. SYRINGAE PV MACULICOLA 1 [Hibiscus trionum]|uniref:RESISTANCE TO PSEUDOMONAS SYRINGAE 3, RESISTANCE TO P. SYRINGAE PV MACULICOLA 1 n=1 Tax=Hibiscus trionum TaxID=183268 RepID=A0A9W7IIG3_HIBTR|nr:RESISTANCE TO PSEUDOMONAS SYRINGAE 3, RESISTANCE TO P. SYRINGAE PV MACULICOLA 1 [Hibiscus trionum]